MKRLWLSSLRNKLAGLFFAITALAFCVVYFAVVPQLQSNLEQQQLDDLKGAASASSGALERVMGRDIPAASLDKLVRAVADGAVAQVTLLGLQRSATPRPGEPPSFYVISDSRARQQVRRNYALAARAIASGRPQSALSGAGGAEEGLVARPLLYRGRADWVAVYTRSLKDVGESVSLVRTQVLAAGAVALLVALLGGYGIARALARRVRRIEAAAKALAAGKSAGPLPVDSGDELGELTRAFNDMQRQLERIDRLRSDFIANASHELRTPIFSLGGFVELLRDEELDPDTREEFLASMHEQVERLKKLAVELLDLSRLDAGSMELNSERVDLAELARGVADEFSPAVTQHGTQLDLSLPEAGIEARCDPERVAQIMRILLDNALVHTPEGTRVSVRAEQRNGAASLEVADSGPGLEAAVVDQVFERFYTADAARGSGLGLAIAKELAERMRGRIIVESRPGTTSFTLELPVVDGRNETGAGAA
jgi:signal transduction histidine kinase